MPKPRSIDPSFWDDPDIATLTRDERLLLIGMITSCADDEGRLLGDAGYLRKRVFGYDDDVSRQDVQGWRDDIVAKCRNVNLYEANGQVYVWFCNWQEYQTMRYVIASKLPAPPLNKEDCGNLPKSLENSPSVGLSSVNVGLSVEAPKNGAKSTTPPTPIEKKSKPPPRTLAAHPLPEDFTITAAMRQWAKDKRITDFIDIDKHTVRFVSYWTVGEGQGKPKKNWLLTWQNWMEDEARKAEERGTRLNGASNGTYRQNTVEIAGASAEGTKPKSRVPGLREVLEERTRKSQNS